MEEQFLNPKKFSMLVEQRVKVSSTGYLDTIMELCDEMSLDFEDIPSLITNVIKGKIEAEAIQLNYMKGGNTLPI